MAETTATTIHQAPPHGGGEAAQSAGTLSMSHPALRCSRPVEKRKIGPRPGSECGWQDLSVVSPPAMPRRLANGMDRGRRRT